MVTGSEGIILDRFRDMLHYIISKCEDKPRAGTTVLAKLCYFSDFDYYELHGRSLSGEQYRKAPYGPLACSFDSSLESLTRSGRIEKKHNEDPADTFVKYKSLQIPKDCFTGDELNFIDWVLERYGSKPAKYLSDLSHNDVPWMIAKAGEIIDYDAVYYRYDNTSVSEEETEDIGKCGESD